jgi:hypothetical protein
VRHRYLGFDAGPFRLAAPLTAVRQIVEVGVAVEGTPRVRSVAEVLGEAPRGRPQALLAFDAVDGLVLLGCCALRGVIDAPPPTPLPRTVACRWPGLLAGTINEDGALTLVVDPYVLSGLLESLVPSEAP